MDKICDKKSFEVGGHWRCGGDGKNPNDHAEPAIVELKIWLYMYYTEIKRIWWHVIIIYIYIYIGISYIGLQIWLNKKNSFYILHGHWDFTFPPQQPMTPDFEGFPSQILTLNFFVLS